MTASLASLLSDIARATEHTIMAMPSAPAVVLRTEPLRVSALWASVRIARVASDSRIC